MNLPDLITRFSGIRALVVGDICLDRWCHYDPSVAEPSRETGIPRVGVVSVEVTPGAGGTIASNLVALGAGRVSVIGAVGQDGFGFELGCALAERRIEYNLLAASKSLQTFTYTKLINAATGVEDLPRCDFINTRRLPADVENQLIANFNAHFQEFDVVLVSDQAETQAGGVVTDWFRDLIADVAERYPQKVIVADSRARIERFRNVMAKPNHKEALAACRRLFGSASGLAPGQTDLQRLRTVIGSRPLLVTQGDRGVLLVDDGGEHLVPSENVPNPIDICGAGDSFAAGMALALRACGDFVTAIRFGNLVSSITIMKKGTGTAAPDEILAKASARLN
ncbi:MAG TPA: PfkB family carbohydrate kinase [Bryobacterales bacterium]|nr:PfkB family carbohydrate kinase [Bryobacterales bacterium]